MHRIPIHFTFQAQQDITEIFNFIAQQNQEAARRFKLSIIKTAKAIALTPEGYPVYTKVRAIKVHYRSIAGFSNIMIYYQLLNPQSIGILRLQHSAREFVDF